MKSKNLKGREGRNKTFFFCLCLLSLSLSSLFSLEVGAQEVNKKEHSRQDHHDSLTHIEVLTVHGERATNHWSEAVESVNILEGDQLAKNAKSSLGETLSKEVGLSSSQFGPNASRPIIRGLDGNRIRLLQDGMSILDLSGASQDHAVPLNPLSAERIEIVRGPLNLLYGSSAIGGVINIVTSKIHRSYHEHALASLDIKANSSNKAQNMAMNLDYGAHNLMFHLDADMSQSDDLKSPKGTVKNSESRQKSYSLGSSYFISPETYVGLGYSSYNNLYGTVAEEDVDIDMNQKRIDLVGHHKLHGLFTGLELKSSQTYYEHQELEDGTLATDFENDSNETSLKLFHKFAPSFTGIIGLQSLYSDFQATGDEAFLPHNKTKQLAFLAFEQYKSQNLKINMGVRLEKTKIEAKASSIVPTAQDKDFDSFSGALGGVYNLTSSLSTGFNLSYNERAPTYQELFANGDHVAMGINENGQANLKKEKSVAAEWSLRHRNQWSEGIFNLFAHKFTNYIALEGTGTYTTPPPPEDPLEIYNYEQRKALLYGAELSFTHFIGSSFQWTLKGDYLRGRDETQHRNLSRMAPLRLMADISYTRDLLSATIHFKRVFKQTSTAPQETSTPAYNLLDFEMAQEVEFNENDMLVYLQLNNLTNEEAINHVSLLKDKMRLPKRHIVVGVRASF